ncbi:MAG: heavy metal-binding domain-containing protein, partial [Eubacterium sp.]|nr:heavy metal-binding domain-containing protein [Eubacterium sp.]
MISVTTPSLENGVIIEYKGIVTGEVVAGINFIKDLGASIRNLVGGRSAGYEEEIIAAKNDAIREMETRAAQMG